MRTSTSVTALAGALGLSSVAAAGDVFAHYMGSSVSSDHAVTDVNDAINLGIDAFAINVLDPDQPYAKDTVQSMFDAASSTSLKLFFSFDLRSHAEDDFSTHVSLWEQFKDHSSYYKIQELPVVSTFGGYSLLQDFQNFKNQYQTFLIPNLDDRDINQYYTNTEQYLSDFNSIVDGYFSWESAWPAGSNTPTNVTDDGDSHVMQYAHDNSKLYMMPLSSLQFKNLDIGHYYRVGATNLAERMTQVLDTKPDLAEIITWNDSGESHYIGNIWPEALPSGYPSTSYANEDQWPHQAWIPIYASFIQAFKNGGSAASMAPPGNDPVGALWYPSSLQSSCSNPPDNSGSAQDSVNYAVVLPASASGWKVQVSIDGNVLATNDASPGLNYASVPGLTTGTPKLDILTSDGASPSYSATGSNSADGSGGVCNFNVYVAGLNPV